MSAPQKLVLALVGGAMPGIRQSRLELDGRGGSIGRSEQSDWVLSGTGISRTHAQVRYLNGMYFIEDCSTNGMLLNGVPLTRGEPAALGHGDRLQLDSMEIAVQVHAPVAAAPPVQAMPEPAGPDATLFAGPAPVAAAPAPAAAPMPGGLPADLGFDDDFGLGPVPVSVSSPATGTLPGLDDLLGGPGAELDPLALFDAPTPAAPAAAPVDRGWNHSASGNDHFHPPRPQAEGFALPENWDLTTGDFAPPAAPAPPPPAPVPAPMPAPPPVAPPAVAPVAPAAVPQAGTAPPAGAGDPRVEQILSIVVDGVMEVLRARAEIKNTFRLPVTLIQRSENNPLKFAATPGEALQKLLASDGGGAFLTGPAAFDDAFDDIRCHQMAMLAGMRAAFEATLFHFSPGRLEQEVDGTRKSAFAGKGRYWERYRENFDALAKDPDECFRRLFGDEFARAYEAQLARLKSARRAQR